MKKLTTDEFIEKARKVHGDKYDYSKVEYIDSKTKVCIICPKHGEFLQAPNYHLLGQGCPQCTNNQRLTTQEFIDRAIKIHGNKYDYSKVKYINNRTKVCVICLKEGHGEFWIKPNDLLMGHGCPQCKKETISKLKHSTTEEFINKAKKIHSNKYNYSKVVYKGVLDEVCIICPIHGEFWQKPHAHLNGCGCQKCGKEKYTKSLSSSKEEFVEKARKVHGNKYDYSKVDYVNNRTKVCIICPQHGEFWQTPHNHIGGNACPKCNEYSLERIVRLELENNNIEYQFQVNKNTFPWLNKLSLDFYLPKFNIAIECQGIQHFKPIDFANFGEEWAREEFFKGQERDERKRRLCQENGIRLLYFSNLGIEYPYEVFEDKEKLLEEIKKS